MVLGTTQQTKKMIRNYYKNCKEKYSAFGKKLTSEEEEQLLAEISKNIEIKIIAENHNRSIGGIRSRIYLIAYKLYQNNVPINEITKIVHLRENDIVDIINSNQYVKKRTILKII